MRLPGYCYKCRRIRQVTVSAAEIARKQAMGSNVFVGICGECVNPNHRNRGGELDSSTQRA